MKSSSRKVSTLLQPECGLESSSCISLFSLQDSSTYVYYYYKTPPPNAKTRLSKNALNANPRHLISHPRSICYMLYKKIKLGICTSIKQTHYCTLMNSSSPLLVGVSLGTHPGVPGNSTGSVRSRILVLSAACAFPLPSIGRQVGDLAASISPSFNTRHLPPFALSFSVNAAAFCSPRRFARSETLLVLLLPSLICESALLLRVNVIGGCVNPGWFPGPGKRFGLGPIGSPICGVV